MLRNIYVFNGRQEGITECSVLEYLIPEDHLASMHTSHRDTRSIHTANAGNCREVVLTHKTTHHSISPLVFHPSFPLELKPCAGNVRCCHVDMPS